MDRSSKRALALGWLAVVLSFGCASGGDAPADSSDAGRAGSDAGGRLVDAGALSTDAGASVERDAGRDAARAEMPDAGETPDAGISPNASGARDAGLGAGPSCPGGCMMPPSVCYQSRGACVAGRCVYPFADGVVCDDGNACTTAGTCFSGMCISDEVTCNAPPPAVCVSPTTLRSFEPVGTCDGTGCHYASMETTCAGRCEAGACGSATSGWRLLATEGAPRGCMRHTAVWTGREMIVWGGHDGATSRADGAAYDPEHDVWTALPAAPGLDIRNAHGAVWTGSEMIVWGGLRPGVTTPGGMIVPGGYLADGAAYNPATRSWRRLATAGAPSARASFVAEWTGREMIVWGGEGSPSAARTGGRYDPATDTWRAMSTDGAPDAAGAGAVWTGSELVVWGGYAHGAYVATGARYEPESDSWTALPTSGAPSARTRPSLAWSGTDIVVFGGFDGARAREDGGKFRPTTGAWSALPSVGAPSSRTSHTAISAGDRVLVWGGTNGLVDRRDGASFDGATSTWTPLPLDGAPTGRSAHTAVWTGTEMLVWGGADSHVRADGARWHE